MSFYHSMRSPLGQLHITSNGEHLTGLYFEGHSPAPKFALTGRRDAGPFHDIAGQLESYFSGHRQRFEVSLELTGTEFQRAVWAALRPIDHGATRTYAAIAAEIGNPRAVRAVGAAIGRNPISIVIPCHRVIGHRGSLTGYAGGLRRKQWLLRHEGVLVDAIDLRTRT